MCSGIPREHADVAQLVEHHLAKVGVAGSNPVVRSTLSNTNAKCPGTESLRGALVVPFVLPLNSGVRVLLILSPRPWPRGRTHRSKVPVRDACSSPTSVAAERADR